MCTKYTILLLKYGNEGGSAATLRLAVISQIRDEQDLIALFLAHIEALFDFIFVVDHRSADSTRQILESHQRRDRFFLYTLNTSCCHQKQVLELLLREAFAKGADFVFALDADEFINVQSRKDLENLLSNDKREVLELKWKNTIIEGLVNYENVPTPASRLYVPSVRSSLGKVVLSRSLFVDRSDFQVALGNHVVWDSNNETIPSHTIGEILHLPFRSRRQFALKLLRGELNRLSQGDRLASEGWHYIEPLKMLGQSGFTDGQMLHMAADYSQVWSDEELRPEQLCEPAFQAVTFKNVALNLEVYESLAGLPISNAKPSTEKLVANYVSAFKMEMANSSRLEIHGSEITPGDNQSGLETDEQLLRMAVVENDRLRAENVTMLIESERVRKGATELQNDVASLREDRRVLQDEANRLEKCLQQLKHSMSEEFALKSKEFLQKIDELSAEIEHRGSILDKKRAELVQSRSTIDELKRQLLDKDALISKMSSLPKITV